MKKSLLALAVLGAFAGTAAAQSSVTIYGVVDLAITKGNGGTAANPGANGLSEAWIQKQSTTSRLGFLGNEDLGGGLSAQFQIEHRFNPDTGAVNDTNVFWAGRSYVQLTSAAAGAVYLGREYSPEFRLAVKSDPFGWDGVGQISSMQYAGYSDAANCSVNGSSVRTSNTVGYKSPSLGGLTFNGAVSLGEGAAGCARTQAFNLEYAAGPIYAGLGYSKASQGAATVDGNSLINLAFHYNFGVVKPMLYYARAKTNGGNNTNKVIELAATAPLGNGVLKAAWARLDPQGANNTATKIGLGYNYNLSKRTNLYFDVGAGREDTKTNNTAYALGLRHTF